VKRRNNLDETFQHRVLSDRKVCEHNQDEQTANNNRKNDTAGETRPNLTIKCWGLEQSHGMGTFVSLEAWNSDSKTLFISFILLLGWLCM